MAIMYVAQLAHKRQGTPAAPPEHHAFLPGVRAPLAATPLDRTLTTLVAGRQSSLLHRARALTQCAHPAAPTEVNAMESAAVELSAAQPPQSHHPSARG